ncbi:MAG: M28 family peptidase, partial [Clostridiales bacterium]|nr:M28 family peptidase [Clostridiales bacterium]
MKKTTRILFILLCVVVMAFALMGCSAGAPKYEPSDPSTFTISVDSVTEKLEEFLSDDREERTSYSDGERNAAAYLRDTLVGYGYTDDGTEETGMIRRFTTKEQVTNNNGTTSTIERSSQNVVAVYEPSALPGTHKNVIVGAYYDNRYSSLSGGNGTKSNGALSNGTGVAALLAISEYLQTEKPKLDFSVTMVFFGASAVNNVGVSKYYDQMTAEEKTNTVLMIELQRLGVDHVYAYTDSRETKRETFFDGVAEKSGLEIYKITQQSPAISGITGGLNGIPYYQWAMNGTFAVFFNHNIPTLNLVGANWETFGLTDNESSDNDDIELTAHATLENLQKLYPDYGEKIA